MLNVLRHYLPARKALLLFSETALLTLVVAAAMSAHLLRPELDVIARITQENLSPDQALLRCLMSSVLLVAVCQVALGFNELYDFRISTSRFDRGARFVASTGSAILLALAALFLVRALGLRAALDFPGMTGSQLVQTLVFTLLFGFGLLFLWRHVFHWALHRWNFNERVLIVGTGPAARSLACEMMERSESGFEAVGLLPVPQPDPALERRVAARESLPGRVQIVARAAAQTAELEAATASLVLPEIRFAEFERAAGRTRASSNGNNNGKGNGNGHSNGHGHASDGASAEALYDLVERLSVDRVVVALEDRRGQLPTAELLRCRLAGMRVQEREELYEHITGKIAVEAMRPSYLIFNRGFSRTLTGQLAKRGGDVCISLVGLALAWPVMLLTALAVRLSSRGPVLYTQERVGAEGVPFTLYKFRSMRSDAESSTGPVWAQKDDPRITPVGRFLRRTRLDELPQLFNVLLGDMSLVGPRPERPVFVAELAEQIPYYALRHVVKPGVTGWAQIN
ncbi:MAG TPA: exopolysaccharide biosynthesis polyprenyl glycosylphosphotransferase, partial [Planctomycetota bacterium]|nr:exopolysaccharide biosynthesis polyprenyl glycosylphosphotransferase [Planctomycetota bacterium]